MQRLLEAMTAVTRLRTQQAELAGEAEPTLGELTRELRAEADAQAAAAREIEALLESSHPEQRSQQRGHPERSEGAMP